MLAGRFRVPAPLALHVVLLHVQAAVCSDGGAGEGCLPQPFGGLIVVVRVGRRRSAWGDWRGVPYFCAASGARTGRGTGKWMQRSAGCCWPQRDRGANLFEAFSNSPPYWMTVSGRASGARIVISNPSTTTFDENTSCSLRCQQAHPTSLRLESTNQKCTLYRFA